ncbi:MAG: helix-turn-helix transcriptional regulator [Lachnospiraceae bacterium]|nr:helix-turn-helix transcriptional regulator [Lachnospiraceae bacterium]
MRISHYLELDKKMKNLRVASGMSQKDMAAKLDLSVPSYSNYENGYSEPPMEILQKFCEILNVSVSDLFGFNVPANTKTNLKTYSDILRLIISLKKAGLNVDCSVTPNKETRRLRADIIIENPQMSAMLSKWNELNDDLEKDKIDSDEYNIWLEDLMSSFNIPIEII